MVGKKKFEPKFMYSISLEDLVPQDNFYRKINDLLDLRFLYKSCKSLYGKTGKPSIDPVVFFKLNLYGYFENISRDRELIRRASDSMAARLYLGYDIDEELPWHSTISRTRKLMKQEFFQELFDRVIAMCASAGLIDGEHQLIDSTLVKANASLESLERRKPELVSSEYVARVFKDNEIEEEETAEKKKDDDEGNKENSINKEEIDNKKEVRKKEEPENKLQKRNELYRSKTDPDSRITSKPGKKTDLYYTTHYSVDSKNKIITNVLTTHSDVSDRKILDQVVDLTSNRLKQLGLRINIVSADKNYCSGKNLRSLEAKGIIPYIPSQKNVNTNGGFSNDEFIYDKHNDEYICPNNKRLKLRANNPKTEARIYKCSSEDCNACPLKLSCKPGKEGRSVRQSIYVDEYKRLSERMHSWSGKLAMKLRKTGPEILFGEAKLYHGLNKFMTRGLDKAQKNSFMIATVQNLKRLLKAKKDQEINRLFYFVNLFQNFFQNILKRQTLTFTLNVISSKK